MSTSFPINRAPVLTLWAAVVAERLGHDAASALTLGKAVAGLNAQSKGRRLGILNAPDEATVAKRARAAKPAAASHVELLGRSVPVVKTKEGLRAAKDGEPESPEAVERYLASKFGEHLEATRAAMRALAKATPKAELPARAFALYEAFRPAVPEGVTGWGAKGVLDLGVITKLAKRG